MPYPRSYEEAGALLRKLDADRAAWVRRRFRGVARGPAPDQHDSEWTRRWERDWEQSERDYYRLRGEDV